MKRTGCKIGGALVLLLGPWCCAQDAAEPVQAAQESAVTVEHWGGFIELPMMKLGITLVFQTGADGATTATIDIPLQGADDLPLTNPTLTQASLSFAIPQVGAVGQLERKGDAAVGTLTQMGQQFPMTLGRYASAEEALASIQPKRPQEPVPPFPYEARQVTIENQAGGVTLAGELTLPNTRELHPAVILISGSGPQDRNEMIADHKPFLVISDHLTRNGFAVLRYDDRGVGGSTGSTMQSTVEDFASDVEAWLSWLQAQPGIDPEHIGLFGHSEGGCVAPLVASGAMKDDVAFIVLMAGMAIPGDEVVIGQTRALFERSGFPARELDRLSIKQRELIDALLRDAPDAELRTALGELIDIQTQATPLDEALRTQAINGQMQMVGSKWYRHLMVFDPRKALAKVTCPMLAINGSMDLQVLPKENLGAIRDAAEAAGNSQVETIELEGLNHMMQRSESGLPAEYGILTQTIDQQVLDLVTDWLKQRVAQ